MKRALVVFGAGAAADYLVRRHQLRQSLRMTKQEVKDEHKMLEDLWKESQAMQSRVNALETILDGQAPDWRKQQ